jgi:hypothetical protein
MEQYTTYQVNTKCNFYTIKLIKIIFLQTNFIPRWYYLKRDWILCPQHMSRPFFALVIDEKISRSAYFGLRIW